MRKNLLRLVALFILLGLSKGVFAQTTSASETKTTATKSGSTKTVAAKPRAVEALRLVATDDAPKAIGPYSQAMVGAGFLFSAGQIPLDPKTGEMATGGIDQAAERVLDNLEGILKAEGLSFADVVKTPSTSRKPKISPRSTPSMAVAWERTSPPGRPSSSRHSPRTHPSRSS